MHISLCVMYWHEYFCDAKIVVPISFFTYKPQRFHTDTFHSNTDTDTDTGLENLTDSDKDTDKLLRMQTKRLLKVVYYN